jgi:hypothetical protein
VTFTGLGLGKEVHTDLDIPSIQKLMPIQNGGISARKIASICRKVLQMSIGNHQTSIKHNAILNGC